MPKGRPSKYDPKFIDEINTYLEPFSTGAINELPSRYKFAKSIGVDDDTLDNWAREHKDFFGALKRIERAQRQQLQDHGLYGGKEVNSTMAIFLLKANHGMIETEKRILEAGESVNIKLDIQKK